MHGFMNVKFSRRVTRLKTAWLSKSGPSVCNDFKSSHLHFFIIVKSTVFRALTSTVSCDPSS